MLYHEKHYFAGRSGFFRMPGVYDNYPRNGAKNIAGEYAAQSDKTVSVDNKNCWLTALSEAAFMTGWSAMRCGEHGSYDMFAHADGAMEAEFYLG